ncbi:MAG TPA: alpha-hydroxy acid oxidase [Candidatus Limnocylindria bacterium]|nr:alpha-hydroxy acid oxidase [Candidatus Limnocylindria bacterium]
MPSPTGLPVPNEAPKAGFEAPVVEDPTLINVMDYEARALATLSEMALSYYTSGSGDERTLHDNRAAFARRRFLPRVMTDTSRIDTSTTVLGREWRVPLFTCPTALHRMAHPDGELATARAAKERGITMTLSTSASTDMADVAAIGGPRWFQVYLLADPGARRALIERAVESGYEALVMTADLQRLGRRERDIRVGFQLPFDVTVPNVAIAAESSLDAAADQSFVETLGWSDLEWLAGFGLPVILKGVLHPDDAVRAFEHGAAAVQVSNHGGRQLDGAIASLDALPAVVAAVDGRGPVLFDGGVRRGTDALMALALGATAVGIGRPILWGLAVAGEAGVGRVLDILCAELEHGMALAGIPSMVDLTPELVV